MERVLKKRHRCDYGCGQGAGYQFDNSKWCCEKYWGRCPIRKKQIGQIAKEVWNKSGYKEKQRKEPKFIVYHQYKKNILKDLVQIYKNPIYGSLQIISKKYKVTPLQITQLFKRTFGTTYCNRRKILSRKNKRNRLCHDLVGRYGKIVLKDLAQAYKNPLHGLLLNMDKKYGVSNGYFNGKFKNLFNVTYFDRRKRLSIPKDLVIKYGKNILKDLALLFKNVNINIKDIEKKYGKNLQTLDYAFKKLYKIDYIKMRKSILTIKNMNGRKCRGTKFDCFVVKQLTIDEKPRRGKNGLLMVICTYCGRYFYPKYNEVLQRYATLKGKQSGESRLYCSDGCKQACPTYYQSIYPKGFKKASSREVQPELRQMRLKKDDYTCQRCGKTIDEVQLHCHHITGVVQNPIESADVDNTITLCKKCHRWVHSQKGCTYYDFRCKEYTTN